MNNDVTIPPWAVRGAKVVCIVDTWDKTGFSDPMGEFTWPAYGGEYTVREVVVRFAPEITGVYASILLVEIVNPLCVAGSGAGMETAFAVSAFRPVKRAKAERKVEAYEPA